MPTYPGYPSAGGPNHPKGRGVTINRKFSVAQHVNHLLVSRAQSLFALRTLRHHGLPTDALHTVCQATVVANLSYASPAWWRLTSAADRDRLEAFLRWSTALGFRSTSAPTLGTICSEADDKLFATIALNPFHLLHHLLPPRRDTHYSLRPRAHDFTLSIRSTSLGDNNFINRYRLYQHI